MSIRKKLEWKKIGVLTVNEGSRMALFGRAVERAAAKVGANKITGEAVYQAIFEGPFKRRTC